MAIKISNVDIELTKILSKMQEVYCSIDEVYPTGGRCVQEVKNTLVIWQHENTLSCMEVLAQTDGSFRVGNRTFERIVMTESGEVGITHEISPSIYGIRETASGLRADYVGELAKAKMTTHAERGIANIFTFDYPYVLDGKEFYLSDILFCLKKYIPRDMANYSQLVFVVEHDKNIPQVARFLAKWTELEMDRKSNRNVILAEKRYDIIPEDQTAHCAVLKTDSPRSMNGNILFIDRLELDYRFLEYNDCRIEEKERLSGSSSVDRDCIDLVAFVGTGAEIIYEGKANKVSLAGAFNNWDTSSGIIDLEQFKENRWFTDLSNYRPMKYEYKFWIDDERWFPDSDEVLEIDICYHEAVRPDSLIRNYMEVMRFSNREQYDVESVGVGAALGSRLDCKDYSEN